MESLSHAELVENRKERMNMQPNLAFIETHKVHFAANVESYLQGEISEFSTQWANNVATENTITDNTSQLEAAFARNLLAHLPEGLQKVSHLKVIDYEWQKNVAVPKFDDEGIFVGAQLPSIEEFNAGEYHKTRVLTGYTKPDGTTIKPTHIPKEVSNDSEAIRLYQAHVLLHEFFHTVEALLRSEEAAKKLLLRTGRTFADWTKDFLESLAEEKQHTSNYAGVYRDAIYDDTGKIRPAITSHDFAVREQMAEAFVAYLLDIISNPEGYTSFQSQSFGNTHAEKELLLHGGQSKRYGLMKELCDAHLQLVDESPTDNYS